MADQTFEKYLNSSLMQTSVQELAKTTPISVPRSFRHETPPHLSTIAPTAAEIPTLDFHTLSSDLVEDYSDEEVQKLHFACKEWGIFQIVNHGIDPTEMEKLRVEIEGFYELPLEEKMKYRVRGGEVEGYGGSMVETLEEYLQELQKLAMVLVGMIAKAMKTKRKNVEEMMEDGMQSVRMTYYPPCPKPELVMGITPHSDASCITILNQIDGVDGLKIVKDGSWVPLSFLPHALVVNVGDILEVLSNGMYKSVEHSVTVNSKRKRISLSFFFNPRLDAEIGPATDIISPQNPPKFKRKTMEQYVKDYFLMKMGGKSNLEHMKI
ncbi:Protein SRG1 [Linum perenne]